MKSDSREGGTHKIALPLLLDRYHRTAIKNLMKSRLRKTVTSLETIISDMRQKGILRETEVSNFYQSDEKELNEWSCATRYRG